MHLKNVKIRNFRGIQDWTIELKPGFNLIKGINGKGKTSILEAIAVGLGGFLSGGLGVSSRHISREEIRREYLLNGDTSYDCIFKIPVELELTAQFEDKEEVKWKRTKSTLAAGRSSTQPNRIAKKAEEMSNTLDTPLPILNYQGASRIWDQKKEDSDNVFRKQYSRTIGYADCLNEASNLKLLLNWCLKMEQVAWQKNTTIAEYEAVKATVGKFMGLINHTETYSLFYDRQQEGLLYRDGDNTRPITDLSAGYQALIWMVFDIAYRMAVLNPFLKENIAETNGIVLIDELDMHLHPKWQWRIIHALKETFPNLQFIASTHSPILFASEKNVWIIDIDNDPIDYSWSHYGVDINTSIVNYQNTGFLPEDVKTLSDEISEALDELNYNKASILMEILEKMVDQNSPLLTGLRARMEFEQALEGD